jgi:hypothetical protein
MDAFVECSCVMALAKWLPEQNQNLFLLNCAGFKPAERKVFLSEHVFDSFMGGFLGGSS